MRKYRYLLIMSLLFIGMAVGCDDEESAPEPTPGDNTGGDALVCKLLNNRAVDRKGGTFFWTVEASEPWELEPSFASWVSVEPLSGRGGKTDVLVQFEELEGNKERSTDLSFVLGEENVLITVRQTMEDGAAGEELVCRFADNQVFGIEGGKMTRVVQASKAWTLEEDSEWLTVLTTSGDAGDTEVEMEATASNGNIRVAALRFILGDSIVELAVVQGLNQNFPLLTLTENVEVNGGQATLFGHCKFVNDEKTLEEVGFAYRLKEGDPNAWDYVVEKDAIVESEFEFQETARRLRTGYEYIYKAYAVLDGEKYFSDESTFMTEIIEPPADGVWYYENFDGMYDPDTKTYSQNAIDKDYAYSQSLIFEADQGYLRKNQPNAAYLIEPYRIDINNLFNGITSANIYPQGTAMGWQFPWWAKNSSEVMQFYEGASGNWKAVARYPTSPWTCTISGLNFEGGEGLQLTFGCYCGGAASSIELPADAQLKVEVSDNETDWKELSYGYKEPLVYNGNSCREWKHIVVDDFPDDAAAIRISIQPSTRYIFCIDEIKVTGK